MSNPGKTTKKGFLAGVGKAVINAMPACERIAKLASLSLDRPLTLREKMQVRVHLPLCRICTRYVSQIAALHELAPRAVDRGVPEAHRLSAEEKDQLKRALRDG